MANTLSGLMEIKLHYPQAQYDSGKIYNGEDVIEQDGKELVQEHYNGYEVVIPHLSNNPELETFKEVSGREYIFLKFNNDYQLAFDSAE